MTPDPNLARQLDAFYISHDLQDAAHQTVINHLLFEPPRPTVECAQRSQGWAKLTCKTVLPRSTYQAAITDMIERGLAWTIDAEKLEQITEHLKTTPALGPTDGMPQLGTLQISIRLANLLDEFWAGIECDRPGVIWSRVWRSEKKHLVYSPTRKGCIEFLRDELKEDEEYPIDIEHLSGPNPCGPWRCQWWRKYETGHVLEVRYA